LQHISLFCCFYGIKSSKLDAIAEKLKIAKDNLPQSKLKIPIFANINNRPLAKVF
jgi:hypothetical protein